jgi:L-seryl-tRNA(Ser) seleniumtransferase
MQYRDLPSVDRILAFPEVAEATRSFSRDWVVGLVRLELDQARQRIREGNGPSGPAEVAERVCRRVQAAVRSEPRRVINATGVIIHTNLGRAPLSRAAIKAAEEAAQGYSNLEFDLDSGRRGSRQAQLQSLVRQLTGAESALVVNNNASAILLGLSSLARGMEVIVSRGEEVEIGGGFRIPDVLLQSGAVLVEVGTTNRTYASDYEAAITENTGALLKVHASNFRIEGFTHAAESAELVALGERYGIPVLHDVGSGCMIETRNYGMAHEPTPQESIAAGVGLVFFSGDKLLGGPQSGIVVGKRDLIRRLERHPLARAVRIDKISIAALAGTLLHYIRGEAEDAVPVWRMISTSLGELEDRAYHWQAVIGSRATVQRGVSAIGGGSLPGETLNTWLVALECDNITGGAEGVVKQLRDHNTPVIARIEGDMVVLDPRTVFLEEEDILLSAVNQALG